MVVFGLLGLILAIIAGALFRVASAVFGRFEGREVERALAAGVVFSVVGIVAPIVLFSGETQIQTVVADPANYGPGLLVVMAIVKLALLAVAFKSGFLGGPTFPAIFASVCVALALSLLLPGIRIDVLIGGVMAGFLIVLFKAPFMVILLDRGDAPGRRGADRAHRPRRRGRDDRPAVHPGRDRRRARRRARRGERRHRS